MIRIVFTIVAALLAISAQAQERDRCGIFPEKFCFQILRTFHKPLVFWWSESPDWSTLHVEVYSGQGGYDWGEVEASYAVKLSAEQSSELNERLNAASNVLRQDSGIGTDGSMWFLETSINGFYLRVGYWSPTLDSEKRQLSDFISFATFVLEISGVDKYDIGALY